MKIKVLGTCCANCKTVEKHAIKAVQELQLEAEIVKVEDIMDIMKYGIMRTPGLVINEKVVSSGKILSVNEIKNLIESNK